MINHVTYHVEPAVLDEAGGLMTLLGFAEVAPDDPFEHGYNVRWFKRSGSPLIHFVSDGDGRFDQLELGHFCVVLPTLKFNAARRSSYLKRDSGSGRIWLGLGNVRVEVRCS